ncbi:helix-turn-helix and ligand-binding sensor domain-containing protein [Flavobacterium sp. UBA6135]|uniref:helix-turn-helix and ligand-binding sensor domain-containing protein n=1 Tax=Flavobacterium sp. UBA6135 TaxID=1946553 RepID=UPI0025BC5659|nr:triple tyrosine motif-containing protein [Flavobacterium sp. UBA6135]
MLRNFIHFSLLSLIFFTTPLLAQDLPPITKYSTTEYGAGYQNWMIAQDADHFLYYANNEGLLEFDGSVWTLYPSPNETILRSVTVIGERIYTGCYMEFGYWVRNKKGRLEYTSLSDKVKAKIVDDEQFWTILDFDHWVIFQSLNQLFVYDTKTESFQIISPKSGLFKAYIVNNSIYYQTVSEGLFEIENGKSKLISNDSFFITNKIVSLSQVKGAFLVITQFNGFYSYSDSKIMKWKTDIDQELISSSIYCFHILRDGTIAIGTVSNGIYVLSNDGKKIYHINQNKGISNNTALSLFEDHDSNIWIGLDNGINCINLKSPIRSYVDKTGVLGTVYASIVHQGKLYIGTNQGLFYKNQDALGDFNFVNGTNGQVWSLFSHDGKLFCAHDFGTFIIENLAAKNIYTSSGTWKFLEHPTNKNLLLQGNYYGISVLEKVNNTWRYRNKISGFDFSSKYFESTGSDELIVSHEYKGVYHIKMNADWTKVLQYDTFTFPEKGKNAGLTKFNSKIYYAYKNGIFVYNPKTKQFKKDENLSKVFEKDEYISGKLMVDHSDKLWFFTKNYINNFSFGKLSSELKHSIIPIPSSMTNSMLGYENITQISNALYLIGTTDGYNTIAVDDLYFNKYRIYIKNIMVNKQNDLFHYVSLTENGTFKPKENNITFNFTVPEYNKYVNAEYQYLLEGLQEDWSSWSTESNVNFKNLNPGSYVFKVRAKIGSTISESLASYTFEIDKPWYSSNLAVLLYIILFFVLVYFINKSYKRYYKKQQEKLIEENNRLLEIKELETEQELMRIKNQQLEHDFETKNKELAASTMTLIKKNELLTLIKEDLKKTSEANQNRSIKSVISTISKNINEEDTWNVFKDAFNNVDKDFLKKIKAEHSSLTPNDLRLCAYLRLNLSSKEIAPLLNISVRSVEIKRYRLRKKMDLPHEQGLVEYILSI